MGRRRVLIVRMNSLAPIETTGVQVTGKNEEWGTWPTVESG
jgi:hypothetical protein